MSKYWIYGRHSVLSALENPERIKHKLVIGDDNVTLFSRYLENSNIPVVISANPANTLKMEDVGLRSSDVTAHQNIFLQTEPLIQSSLESIYSTLSDSTSSLIIVLDQITDPRNVGAIIRSAAAFGAIAIIMPCHKSPMETAPMVKSASGAFEKLPIVYVPNLVRAMGDLKEIGYWIIGFSSHTDMLLNNKCNEYKKAALVFGREDKGVRRLLTETCDLFLKINMCDSVESLNVSNAVAVAAHAFYGHRS